MKIKVISKNPILRKGLKMKRGKRKTRKHNPAGITASKKVSIPISTLMRNLNPPKKHHRSGGKRRRNPEGGGVMGFFRSIINKEALITLGKGALGAGIGAAIQSKGIDRAGISGPAKKGLGIIAALVAPRVIPDKTVALGTQAAIGLRLLQQITEAQGINFFSGAERLTQADINALNRLTTEFGAAIPKEAADLLGEAIRRNKGQFGEAARHGALMGEAIRRRTFNPARTLDMMGATARFETVEIQ
jgi:hypothetical protein